MNNRDLNTFDVDLKTTETIKSIINKDITFVSESGISKREDLEYLKSINTDAVLVGEHFMRSENIKESFKEFKKWCLNEN